MVNVCMKSLPNAIHKTEFNYGNFGPQVPTTAMFTGVVYVCQVERVRFK
jgi:hypothetical protein